MHLNDLLIGKGIDTQQVLVLRHRPHEPGLNKVLPWLAAEKPDVFNAYQQTQGEKLEKTLQGAGYVVVGSTPAARPLFSFRGNSGVTAHGQHHGS